MSTILQKEHATWNVTMTVYRPMLWDVFGAHVVGQLQRARNIARVPTNTETALIFKMARNLARAQSYIFVTKNASRFADDLAMGTGIQNPPSKKGASPIGKK